MEKLISVINDNIRSIISGIKINAADIEKSLNGVISEMDNMVSVANGYKEKVEKSRNNIEKLESEIADLERDLDDLQSKFGGKDFGELLAAGNKEISTKIIEKRALISKESDMILELTDKAHKLKEDLLNLKNKKNSLEQSLESATIVKKYYDGRLTEVIEFAEEHPTELDKYIEEMPSEKLILDADFDTEEIGGSVDGKVFDEIDNIKIPEPSIDMIEEVMNSSENIIDERSTEEDLDIDISMTKQLDDIILAANEVLAGTKNIKNDLDEEPTFTAYLDDEESKDKVQDDSDSVIEDFMNEEASDDEVFAFNPLSNNELEKPIDLDLDKITEEAKDIDNEDEKDLSLENLFENDNTSEISISPIVDNGDVDNASDGIVSTMQKYGLIKNRFNATDLDLVINKLSPETFEKYINIILKHSINVEVLYDATNVLVSITPEDLDKILTILESTAANTDDIEMIFNKLDLVDIAKLEVAAYEEDNSLSKIIYVSSRIKANDEIVSALNLTSVEVGILKTNTNDEEYDRMCAFSNIISKNYDTLNNFNIKNMRDCFLKHPHRFLLNPSAFSLILDKYDPEDLVRCINKNIAVIDRL